MNLLKLVTDKRLATVVNSFSDGGASDGAVDAALDVAARLAPAVSALTARDVTTIDEEFLNSLAALIDFDLAGAAGPIVGLLREEAIGFQGTLVAFLGTDQGKQFLRRFFAGGRVPLPTQCPECGYITF